MSPVTALSCERARDLGRTLAHGLVPLPREPGGLAESASLTLLQLLPTWLSPGEEAVAAALHKLVRRDCFSAYLLAPVGADGGDAADADLRLHLKQSVDEPLQPLLLLFSQGCREALRSLAAGSLPEFIASQAHRDEVHRGHAADAAPLARTGDSGSLAGLALAAMACFAMGWLGYRLTQGLGRSPADPGLQQLVTAPPRAGSSTSGRLAPVVAAPTNQQGLTSAGTAAGQAVRLASLQCLAGGQSEIPVPADPSNYGPRLGQDWQGRPVPNTPALAVLHETVVDEATALTLFRRHHSDDAQQASYHVLIGRDGRRLRLVADEQRAFGAGDSGFEGLEVQLKPGLKPSVNNSALHVSLVSPSDGADGEARRHAGYTPEQYRSLASQIALWQARWGIPGSRVVTHQEVDRSGSRRDPRSFDWSSLGRDLRQQWLACGLVSPLADLRR